MRAYLLGGGAKAPNPRGWTQILDADFGGGSGSALTPGNTITAGGLTWTFDRSATTVGLTHNTTGVTPTWSSGSGYVQLGTPISGVLGRALARGDMLALFGLWTPPTPAGTAWMCLGLWRRIGSTSSPGENISGGYARISTVTSAYSRSNTTGTSLLDQNSTAVTLGSSDVVGAVIDTHSVQGFHRANVALPAPAPGDDPLSGYTGAVASGGIVAQAYDTLGMTVFIDASAASGTLRAIRAFRYDTGA